MTRRPWLPMLVALVLAGTAAWSAAGGTAARGPATGEERARVVRLAAELEARPLGKQADRQRRWLDGFLVEVPDIHVPVCRNLLLPMVQDSPLATPLVAQMLYSGAAFLVEHPERAGDEFAIYQAGVAGALRAYESVSRDKPRRRIALLDQLVQKRERGELARFVRDGMTGCRGSR